MIRTRGTPRQVFAGDVVRVEPGWPRMTVIATSRRCAMLLFRDPGDGWWRICRLPLSACAGQVIREARTGAVAA